MLNRLKIENFKAWRHADLQLGKVTGLFGTNSAGKSSLLQLLLLLKQTANATDRSLVLDLGGPADVVSLGTFKDVIHQHDEQQQLSWLLDWTLPDKLVIPDPMHPRGKRWLEADRLETRCEVGLKQTRLWARELAYRFNGVEFRLHPKSGSETKFDLATDSQNFKFIRSLGRKWPLPHPVKTHLFPNEVRNYFQNANFLGFFELEYENLMDSIHYLGPLRDYPRREYHWSGSAAADVGERGESTINAILAATRDGEMRSLGYKKRRKTFQEMIAYWLSELGLIHEFSLEEIAEGTNLYQAMVRTGSSGVTTALTDVGFGVSQVLPAIVLLYHVPEGSMVLMEQPEIHLHPAVQCGLADVMLNVAKVRNVQVIVESHSEHLLRRLQRRVAEEEATSEDVKLYFVSTDKGVAEVSDLELNEYGEIKSWPENFFGDEMGEIAAISKASLSRRLRQAV